jgi:uncharacterized membrane protein YphA (DoxX/SURF4 family)
MNDRVPRSLLVILRLHLGVILIITDLGKMFGSQPFADEMLGFISGGLKRPGFAWYHHFLSDVVIPHATLFAMLVMIGELVAGLSLLTGTLTRAGAAIAMVLFLNYMWTKGRWFWSPDSEDAAVFFSALVVMLGAAGRKFGLDSYLARRWPRALLW